MFKSKFNFFPIVWLAVLFSHSVQADISPGQVLDNSWASVCPNAAAGSELATRCARLNGGSSAGIEAGTGNNASTSSGTGNSTIYSDRQHKRSIEQRLEKLKQKRAAGDILSGERLGFFASGKMTEIERENTVLESGYESDTHGFTVGGDYFFSDQFVAGLAVGYSDTDLDYSHNAGYVDYESISVLSYANYRLTNNFIVDGYAGWTGVDYDIKRNIVYNLTCGCDVINSTARSDTEADKVLAGLNFAYAFNYSAFELTPMLKLDYSGTFIESFKEKGGSGLAMKFDNQNIQSFRSTLGFDSTYSFSFPWGILIPRIKAGYIHEFLNKRRTIHASFVQDTSNYNLMFKTDKPDRDYFVLGGGISTVLTHSIQLFVDYERIEGNRYLNNYTVSGGVRIAF